LDIRFWITIGERRRKVTKVIARFVDRPNATGLTGGMGGRAAGAAGKHLLSRNRRGEFLPGYLSMATVTRGIVGGAPQNAPTTRGGCDIEHDPGALGAQ
jgi:hypothetical protein